MSGPRADSAKPASFVRAMSRVVARTATTDVAPHHSSFLDDIAANEPASATSVEARACLQHALGAAGQSRSTAFPLAAGAALMWLALASSLVIPAPSIPYDDTFASGFALVSHLVGLGGIAAAGVASGATGRRRFLWWGLLPTGVAQVLNLVTSFPHVNDAISFGDTVLRVGESVGLAATLALLIGVTRRHDAVFSAGWRGLTLSMLIVAGAHVAYAFGFARAGDVAWVCVVGLLLVGHSMFLGGIARSRPAWWHGEPRDGRSG